MAIGELKDRVVLKKISIQDNGSGGSVEVESSFNIWVKIEAVSGYKNMIEGQPITGKSYKIKMLKRLDFDVEEGDLIYYKDKKIFLKQVSEKGIYLFIIGTTK